MATVNDWTGLDDNLQAIWIEREGENEMRDPFEKIRRLTLRKEGAFEDWYEELRLLRAAGYSVRAIAEVAGVSHDTVWKATR